MNPIDIAAFLKGRLVLMQKLAQALEVDFPEEIRKKKWQQAKHDPTPWDSIYQSAKTTIADEELLMKLAVRSELAVIIEKMNTCVGLAEQVHKPVRVPKLARTRGSSP